MLAIGNLSCYLKDFYREYKHSDNNNEPEEHKTQPHGEGQTPSKIAFTI